MKKILITGVAGFIGSNLAERLLQSQGDVFKVVGIDNLSYGIREQIPRGVAFHKRDIRSNNIYSLFKGIDFVFHLAAKNCISDCQNDPVETADINVSGTVNVFEAARMADVKKVIYAESSAMYEGSYKFPTPETDIKPESFYACSKTATMYFAEAYQRYYGLNFTALRYFNVYGSKQDYRRTIPPVMSAFIIKLLKGQRPIIYGTGRKRRDFVHVDDVNDFHLLCMKDKRTNGQVYNVGSGNNLSILDIYNNLSGILHSSIKPAFKPNLPGEAQETLADISKAKKMGWKPKIDIRDGLNDMIKYIKYEIAKGNIKIK